MNFHLFLKAGANVKTIFYLTRKKIVFFTLFYIPNNTPKNNSMNYRKNGPQR